MNPLILLALSVPPVAEIPRPLACLIRGGHDARFIILGDSISNSVSGTFYDNGTDRTHFPINVGMHNVWTPMYGWRGVNVSPADGAYKNWRGVASQGWGTQYGPRVDGSDYELGQTIDTALEGDIRATLFTDSGLHTSLASSQIGHGSLVVRQLVWQDSYESITATRTGGSMVTLEPSGTGWQTADYQADGYDPSSSFITTVIGPAIFGGTYFYNSDSDGMSIISIAQGGDNTLDHLRTSATFGTTGWYADRSRGYHDDGLISWLNALEGFDGTPCIVIALGTNIAQPDNGGSPESSGGLTTEQYAVNVRAIMDRWRGIYTDPYFLLLAMYGFGASPNAFVDSRAEWLWDIAQDDPSRIGFVNLPAAMDPFDPDWYFGSTDYHLSSLGSLEVARVIWDAAEPCPADLTLDDTLNSEDFFLYLTWFSESDPRADLDNDQAWTSTDFFAYLDLYVEGC